jgi:hypothetical protein
MYLHNESLFILDRLFNIDKTSYCNLFHSYICIIYFIYSFFFYLYFIISIIFDTFNIFFKLEIFTLLLSLLEHKVVLEKD